MTDNLPPLPEPADYYYEWSTSGGAHRSFSSWPWNGLKPEKAVAIYTAAQVEEIRRAAVLAERLATLEAVNALIKDGPFKGNGYDDLAQNNGVILAANLLASRVYAIRKGTP